MQLENRKSDLEGRIEEYEGQVQALKDNHVMLDDGEKKDAVFSEILQHGLSDFPVEGWAGYCSQLAVCLRVDGSFGVEWCVWS